LISIDQKIKSVLNLDLQEREKILLVNQLLQEYLRYKTQYNTPIQELSTLLKPPPPPEEKPSPRPSIVHNIPSQHRNRAEEIIHKLPPSITWDSYGRISHIGEIIPDSNIVDILKGLVAQPTWTRIIAKARKDPAYCLIQKEAGEKPIGAWEPY
jgi:hypothetical protein